MFEILDQSTSDTVGFKASGKVSAQDYESVLARIDSAIAGNDEINLLILVEDFHGWDGLDAAKADFRFGKGEYRNVRRCAFVSDKNWHKWVVRLIDPFTRRTEEKYFELEELDEAWAWCKDRAQD